LREERLVFSPALLQGLLPCSPAGNFAPELAVGPAQGGDVNAQCSEVAFLEAREIYLINTFRHSFPTW
jgi:hypothetical protein